MSDKVSLLDVVLLSQALSSYPFTYFFGIFFNKFVFTTPLRSPDRSPVSPQDPSLATAHAVIDLVDAIRPGTINYELVRQGGSEEVRLPRGDSRRGGVTDGEGGLD